MLIKEWKDNIVFLYKVVKGEADKSYGVEVAKLAGFPKTLTDRAFEILDHLEMKGTSKFRKIKKKNISEKNDIIKKTLDEINPDELTPLNALDIIYKLKSITNN